MSCFKYSSHVHNYDDVWIKYFLITQGKCTRCGDEVPGMILLCDLKGAM
jgi:hypothetical protein